jgi:hypothetical protein
LNTYSEEHVPQFAPNDISLLILADSILIDINDEGILDNRYLSMKSDMISLDIGAEFSAL